MNVNWDREMLDGIKQGDREMVATAVDHGANCTVGITFMFKIFKYLDPSVSVPIIKMLRDRPNTKSPQVTTNQLKTASPASIKQSTPVVVPIQKEVTFFEHDDDAGKTDAMERVKDAVARAKRASLSDMFASASLDALADDEDEKREAEEFRNELLERKHQRETNVCIPPEAILEEARDDEYRYHDTTDRDVLDDDVEFGLPSQPKIEVGSKQPWYTKNMSKSKCVGVVQEAGAGEFVICKMKKLHHYVLIANDCGTVVEYDIRPQQGKLDICGQRFSNLNALVRGVHQHHLIGNHSNELLVLRAGCKVRQKKQKKKKSVKY
eukprot:m.122477 g.122477  ORF g.122477 m.122477 type:complete len:322 (+) comp28924_c0_seq1:105-1070(+)